MNILLTYKSIKETFLLLYVTPPQKKDGFPVFLFDKQTFASLKIVKLYNVSKLFRQNGKNITLRHRRPSFLFFMITGAVKLRADQSVLGGSMVSIRSG